jgi:hypothetical protein
MMTNGGKGDSKDVLETFQPMGKIGEVKDVVDAVLYLTQAGHVGSRWRLSTRFALNRRKRT